MGGTVRTVISKMYRAERNQASVSIMLSNIYKFLTSRIGKQLVNTITLKQRIKYVTILQIYKIFGLLIKLPLGCN